MEKIRHLARNYHEDKGKFVIFSTFGRIKKTLRSKDVVIILTDGGCALWDKKSDKEPKSYGSWINIQSFSLENDKISLTFHQKDKEPIVIEFETDDSKYAVGAIGDILQHILYRFELDFIKLHKFKFIPAYPTNMSIVSRLIERAENENMAITGKQIKTIEDIFEVSKERFVLSDIPDVQNIFLAIIDIIPMTTFIRELVFQNLDIPNQYRILSAVIKQSETIDHIILQGQSSSRIEFFDGIKDSNQIALNSLTLVDANMSIDEMNKLSTINSIFNFSHIGFQNAFSETAKEFFYNGYVSTSLPNLISLNLDNMPNLNIEKLVPQISKLKILSLCNCGLEIGNTLEYISNTAPELRYLNISSNRCDKIPKNLNLPPKLFFYSIENISWKPGTFLTLLKILFDQIPDNSHLDFSDAHVEDDDWPSIFRFFSSQNGLRLQGFYWNHNIIKAEMCKFLESCSNLNILHVSGVLSNSSTDVLELFAGSLQKLTTLKTLRLSGSDTIFLGSTGFATISKLFASQKSLEYLDLSENKLQGTGVSSLPSVLKECSALKVLVFDNNDVENADILVNFAKSFDKSFSFPINDIGKLEKSESISDSQMKEICKANRSVIAKPNRSEQMAADQDAQYPKPSKNPLDQSSTVFFFEFPPIFPASIPKNFAITLNTLPEPVRTPYPKKNAKKLEISDTDGEEDEIPHNHSTPKKISKFTKRRIETSDDEDINEVSDKFESESDSERSTKNQEFKLRSNWSKSITFEDSDSSSAQTKPKKKLKKLYEDSEEKPVQKRPIPIPPKRPSSAISTVKRQKHPEMTESSSGEGEHIIKPVKNKVKQIAAPQLDDISDSNPSSAFGSDDEDDEFFEPKDPDWSFPLRYVPPPQDTERIVRQLGDKYSLGSLLTAVKRS